MLCVQHNICGDQPEVSDCMPDSSGFLSLEFFTGLRCPFVPESFEDAAAEVYYGELAEEPGRGAPPGNSNETSTSSSSFSVVAPIWPLGHISSCN